MHAPKPSENATLCFWLLLTVRLALGSAFGSSNDAIGAGPSCLRFSWRSISNVDDDDEDEEAEENATLTRHTNHNSQRTRLLAVLVLAPSK